MPVPAKSWSDRRWTGRAGTVTAGDEKFIEEAVIAYLQNPTGDESYSVLSMGDHCSTHNIYQVDGDIDVTELSRSVARAIELGWVEHR